MKLSEKRFENPDLEAEAIQFLQMQVFKIIEDFKKEYKHFGNLSDPQIISRIGIHNFFSNVVMKAASSVNVFSKRLVKAEREGDKNRIDIYKNALANANIMFDLEYVEQFKKCFSIYPLGCHVMLSNGLNGYVISQNKGFADRPVVRVLKDENQEMTEQYYEIDLLKQSSLLITDVI